MPRARTSISKLPGEEVDVCIRLQHVRERLRLTQAEIADALQVSRESVASYESARVPVSFDFGLKFCQMFRVSEKWLAEGSENFSTFINHDENAPMSVILEPECWQISRGTSYINAWDKSLKGIYERVQRANDGMPRVTAPVGKEGLSSRFFITSELRFIFDVLRLNDESADKTLPLPSTRFSCALAEAMDEIKDAVSTHGEIDLTDHEREWFAEWLIKFGHATAKRIEEMDESGIYTPFDKHIPDYLRWFYAKRAHDIENEFL